MQTLLAKLLRMAASFAVAVPALGCTPARLLNAVISKDGYRIEKGIAYGDEARQKLDLYIPDGDLHSAKVVVFFYGGRWEYGSRQDYVFVGQALADKGVIAVLADYRLYPKVRFPSFVEDGAKAIRWTRDSISTFGGDPGQIYLMGHSAGAHIAAMLALDPKFLKAETMTPTDLAGMIGLAGPYDFLPIKDPVIQEIFASGDIEKTQPVHHVTDQAPPMLLLTGSDDLTVLPRNTKALAGAVNDAGGSAIFKTYDGIGHIGMVLSLASPFRWLAPVLNDVMEYLDRPATSGYPADGPEVSSPAHLAARL